MSMHQLYEKHPEWRERVVFVQVVVPSRQVHIIDGNKVIEVRMSGVNKGLVAGRLLERTAYDFILAIGDDKTDEDMFRVISEKGHTIKVGNGNTCAQYYMPEQSGVLKLLEDLAQISRILVSS